MHNAMADRCHAPAPELRMAPLPANSFQFVTFCGVEYPFAQLCSLSASFVCLLISRAWEKEKSPWLSINKS